MEQTEAQQTNEAGQDNAQTNREQAYFQYLELLSGLQSGYSKSKPFYWLQCAAEAEHAQAQYELGKELALSDSTVDMAVYWLRKAAVQGIGEAFAELDELDTRGYQNVLARVDMAKLYTQAASALQIAADVGNSAAAVEWAVCCQFGYGVEKSKTKAFQLYAQQASLQNTRAAVKQGDCYMYGIGVNRNLELAAQCYRRAAECGSTTGLLQLAKCQNADLRDFKRGITVFDLVTQASGLGDVCAQYQLGRCLASGIGTAQDEQQAIAWFERAARKNNMDAICALAELSIERGNTDKAIELFDKAVGLGSVVGQRRLADCYFNGIGVGKDQKRAAELYEKAAEQLDVLALRQLGLCYLNGIGVEKDINKAAELFKLASAAGDAESQFYYADLLLRNQKPGTGNPEAIAMLLSAVDKGNHEAMCHLAECYRLGIGVRKNIKRADEIYEQLNSVIDCNMCVRIGIQLLRDDSENSQIEAFGHFKQAARLRNAEGCYQTGLCYENGIGVKNDVAAAVNLYKQAADMNHAKATVKLAQLYATKQAEPESAKYAFELYCKTAKTVEMVEDDIMYELAQCYENGIGTEKSPRLAVKLYANLADTGHVSAMKKLLAMYRNGMFGDSHNDEAIQVHMIALEHGDIDSMCELASCCLENRLSDELVQQIVQDKVFKAIVFRKAKSYALGLAEPDNEEEMCAVLKLAEDQSDPDILCALGKCYNYGRGVGRDVTKAGEYYAKAAEAGSFAAIERLKNFKYKNVDEQLKAAFQHFKQQADAGNTNAQFAIASCHYWGIGIAINYQSAIEMCQAVENQQNSNMMVLLGWMYQNGHGVEKNETKAVELYKQAAKAGNSEAQFKLGQCYIYAWGVAKDYKQAVVWYEKAAAQGHVNAAWNLGYCYKCGIGVEEDSSKEVQYYTQAAITGGKDEQKLTGFCYNNEEIAQQNYKRAVYWYQKASEQRNTYDESSFKQCLSQMCDSQNCSLNITKFKLQAEPLQPACANQRRTTAFNLAKFAAERGCNKAYSCLGDCYYNGFGTARDITAAAKCYERVEPSNSQKYLNLVKCYVTQKINNKNEIDCMAMLKQANSALRIEINAVLEQIL